MNKIVINNNNLVLGDVGDIVLGDTINFTKSGSYFLEIVDSDKFDFEIVIGDNVFVKLFIWSKGNSIDSNIKYVLGDNSNLEIEKFSCNKSVNENVMIFLNGIGSKCIYKLSGISRGIEEYNMKIYHNNKMVNSYISNKFIGYDKANISFDIDSILDKGNVDVIMDQVTKILTFGDVKARVCPNMYIDEDSVTAKHGTVISDISYDDIFYLMSRGIFEEDAIRLLSIGFIMSNMSGDFDVRDMIMECI